MRKLLLIMLFAFAFSIVKSQTPNQNIPLSYEYYQKLNTPVYDITGKFHSSIKGYFADDSTLVAYIDSLSNIGIDSSNRRSWIRRKLTDEHLLIFNSKDYKIYADFLPDLSAGRDFSNRSNTWMNTRGFQIGGSIGDKFSFYTSGYENQGVFAN